MISFASLVTRRLLRSVWLIATILLLGVSMCLRGLAQQPEVKNVERVIEGPPVEIQKLRREVQRLEAEVERLRKIVENRSPGEERPTSAKPMAPDRIPSSITVRPTQRFDGHQDIVSAVAIAPNGFRGASASHDGTVRIWDLVRHVENSAFDTPDNQLYAVAWSPDGKLIAAGGTSGVQLLRADTGELLQSLAGGRGGIRSLQFSRDGKVILSAGGNILQIWDVATGTQQESHRIDLDITQNALWTNDQRGLLCVGGFFNNSSTEATYYVRLWEPDTGQELFRLSYPKRSVFRAARLVADDTHILTADPSGRLREWDIATGKECREWPLNNVDCLDLSADARYLVTAGKVLQLWDFESARLIDSYPLPENGSQCVALSRDGVRAIVGGRDRTVRSFSFYELVKKAAKSSANEPSTEEAVPRQRRPSVSKGRPAIDRP